MAIKRRFTDRPDVVARPVPNHKPQPQDSELEFGPQERGRSNTPLRDTMRDFLAHDPETVAKLNEVEAIIETEKREIAELALQHYEIGKQINRKSIRLNHFEKLRVRLTLPPEDE